MVAALQFFMGSDEKEEESDSEAEVGKFKSVTEKWYAHKFFPVLKDEKTVIREVGMAARVNKKSRKREKQMEKVKKTLKVWFFR